MAQVKYKDGSTPDIIDVVKTATFLLGAGQHTTVLLLASAFRILAEDQELQATLRASRELIPVFFEEACGCKARRNANTASSRKQPISAVLTSMQE